MLFCLLYWHKLKTLNYITKLIMIYDYILQDVWYDAQSEHFEPVEPVTQQGDKTDHQVTGIVASKIIASDNTSIIRRVNSGC